MSQPELAVVAVEAARVGGEIVAKYFRDGVTLRSATGKESFNLVSDADVESEHAIVAAIRRSFPDHAVLAEEAHKDDANAEHLWVIDPLDGTNNFAHRIPHFAVSIAYCYRGQPMCGVIHHPIRGEWYVAERGRGAFANGQQVRVAETTRLDESLIGLGFYYDRGAKMEGTLAAIRDLFRANIHGIRRMGAAALDLCYVGQGLFQAFFEYELAPWDFAAGALFVEEAGGRVTTCRGEPLGVQKSSILATNGRIHDAVLEIVQRHLPAEHTVVN